MVEFCGGEELYPFGWIVSTEDAEICFKFLICLFSLAISLWMVSSREANIILEEMSEFLGKGRSKLRAMVGNESVV